MTDPQRQPAEQSTPPVRGARSPTHAVPSKAALVEKLLARPRGVTTAELMGATGWQNHSVRAFLSGLRKKGRLLVKEARKTGDIAYRLAGSAVSDAAPAVNADTVAQ